MVCPPVRSLACALSPRTGGQSSWIIYSYSQTNFGITIFTTQFSVDRAHCAIFLAKIGVFRQDRCYSPIAVIVEGTKVISWNETSDNRKQNTCMEESRRQDISEVRPDGRKDGRNNAYTDVG